jgi:hypothetical protein
MVIKIGARIALFLLLLNCLVVTCRAYDYSGKLDVTVTEVPYRPVHAFLGVNFQSTGSQLGGNMTMTSARQSDFQFETMIGYRNLGTSPDSSLGSFDTMLGGAVFPRYPTFVLSNMPVRLKISLLGGLGITNENMIFSACAGASLVFSSGDDPSGLVIGAFYWPSATIGVTKIPGSVMINLGFIFAPN